MASASDIETGKKTDEASKFLEYVDNEVKHVTSTPFSYTIDRVLEPLRNLKPEAYTPCLVSIGPLHCQDTRLKLMEGHKLRLVKRFIDREYKNGTLAIKFESLKELEKRVRQSYSEVIPLEENEFVRMMMVDGCFLLELINQWSHYTHSDPVFKEAWMPHIMHDLMLLENQLPFIVLRFLFPFNWTDNPSPLLNLHTKDFLEHFLPILESHIKSKLQGKDFKSSVLEMLGTFNECDVISNPLVGIMHMLDFARHLLVSNRPEEVDVQLFRRKRCATELKKVAAVKFKKSEEWRFTDISFDRGEGMLEIPSININDNFTESLLRNLIALEQSSKYVYKYVTAYVVFMNDLISSPEDAKLLMEEDGEIFGMREQQQQIKPKEADVVVYFNNLLKEVTVPPGIESCFSVVYKEVERYYDDSWYRVGAIWYRFTSKLEQYLKILKTTYFDSPWSIIAFLAAAAILALTIAQTYASFKSLNK